MLMYDSLFCDGQIGTLQNRFGSLAITQISKMLLMRNEPESVESCDTLHIYMLNQQLCNKKIKMLEYICCSCS